MKNNHFKMIIKFLQLNIFLLLAIRKRCLNVEVLDKLKALKSFSAMTCLFCENYYIFNP